MDLIPQGLYPHLPLIAAGVLVVFCLLLLTVTILFLRLKDIKKQVIRESLHLKESRINIATLQEEKTRQKVHIAKLATFLKNEKKHTSEKLAILEDAREKLRLQFQILSQQIFDEKSEKFGKENKERLTTLLQPLQDQLHAFRTRVDEIQVNDVRERMSLKKEIVHLRELNQQISQEAVSLTRALKGDKKIQGNWGELVLERVLEQCGLRKGMNTLSRVASGTGTTAFSSLMLSFTCQITKISS